MCGTQFPQFPDYSGCTCSGHRYHFGPFGVRINNDKKHWIYCQGVLATPIHSNSKIIIIIIIIIIVIIIIIAAIIIYGIYTPLYSDAQKALYKTLWGTLPDCLFRHKWRQAAWGLFWESWYPVYPLPTSSTALSIPGHYMYLLAKAFFFTMPR